MGRAGGFQSSSNAKTLRDSLDYEGVAVDVLVISPSQQLALQAILAQRMAQAWEDFEANLHVPLLLID